MIKKKALFLVGMEWEQDGKPIMTAQTGRDKIFDAVQRLWVSGQLTKASIEQVDAEKPTPKLSRERGVGGGSNGGV